MSMEKHSEIAVKYFKSGYNCAQSVFLAFAPEFGFDDETALKISSSFGGGMGRLREVCGVVTAMFAVLGLKYGYTQNNNDELKAKHYALIQQAAEKFKARCGSIICRELLGDEVKNDNSPVPSKRTDEYYQTRPCCNFVKIAADILDDYLFNEVI